MVKEYSLALLKLNKYKIFCTVETSQLNLNSQLGGQQGGFVKTTAEANDGLHFFVSSGNMDTGTFTLYGLKK